MQYYFFRSPEKTYAQSFRQFAIKQNVAVANILSATLIVTCALVFALKLVVDYGLIVDNPREYRDVLIFLASCSVIYRVLQFLTRKGFTKKKIVSYWILSSYYALVLISGFMWLTFIAQHNPRNAMTMFLIGMFGVGVLWIFDFWGTISIAVLTFIVFALSIHLFQGNHLLLWQDYIVSFVVLLLFFIISRVVYSYHYSYYIQVKTIEEKNKEIQRINQTQTQILDMVAHDLRSPFNSIKALMELIEHPTSTDDEKNEYYSMVLAACNDADGIINDLIDTVKRKDNSRLPTEDVLLNDFLNSIHQQWALRMPAERKLIYKNPENNITAEVNKQKLQRVIDNLINNAVKFTRKDGIIELGLNNKNDSVCISVKDNGIGIPDNLKPYLFERFSRAGRSGIDGEQSYGLGLSICKQIVQQHGGTIDVDSTESNGTIFQIFLPISKN